MCDATKTGLLLAGLRINFNERAPLAGFIIPCVAVWNRSRQPRKYPSDGSDSARPRRVCSYYLALSSRFILTTRHGVSCDGPADSARLDTSGIDSTPTKPNDVRCSLWQLQLEWIDGSYVHTQQ